MKIRPLLIEGFPQSRRRAVVGYPDLQIGHRIAHEASGEKLPTAQTPHRPLFAMDTIIPAAEQLSDRGLAPAGVPTTDQTGCGGFVEPTIHEFDNLCDQLVPRNSAARMPFSLKAIDQPEELRVRPQITQPFRPFLSAPELRRHAPDRDYRRPLAASKLNELLGSEIELSALAFQGRKFAFRSGNRPIHVAVVSRGVAGSQWRPLKMHGNYCDIRDMKTAELSSVIFASTY